MQLKTILNRVTSYKSFVFGKATWVENSQSPAMEIQVEPRQNGVRICSGCERRRPGYDTMGEPRRFEFVPLWGITIYFVYRMRRVQCPTCGVKVERVPWAEGKSPMTTEYTWFLARWAKRMSWKEVSEAFHVSWDRVYEAVKHAVSWGLEHRNLEGIEAIGVDEVQWHRGHQYQTVVYQLDEDHKRLLWIGPDRTAKTLLRFFRFLGKTRTSRLQFICSDMWQAYLKVIAKKAPQAVHVLDRFHIICFGEWCFTCCHCFSLGSRTRGEAQEHPIPREFRRRQPCQAWLVRRHQVPNCRKSGGGKGLYRIRMDRPPIRRERFVACPTPVRTRG